LQPEEVPDPSQPKKKPARIGMLGSQTIGHQLFFETV
jgi:hypothetical protein